MSRAFALPLLCSLLLLGCSEKDEADSGGHTHTDTDTDTDGHTDTDTDTDGHTDTDTDTDTDGHTDTDTDTDGETHEEADFHWPETEGNPDPGIPGWVGRTKIPTTEGCWMDNDGVDPALAGCHTLHDTSIECDTCADEVLESIGEVCYTFTRDDGAGGTEEATFLIETNPEAGKCHAHVDGIGHPDVFDCDLYCKGMTDPELGAPYSGGDCVAVTDDTCSNGPQDSAACSCWL